MIKEYGIDPESLNSYDKFFRIIPLFGINNYRLIRKYPSKWCNLVKKVNDNLPDYAKHKLIEKLSQVEKQLLDCCIKINGNPSFDGNKKWLENAEFYHYHIPFDGIISTSNPRQHSHVILDEFLSDSDPLMDNSDCYSVRRTAYDMAVSIKSILENAKEIHFVDPFFRKLNVRHIRPLQEFLKIIYNRQNRIPIQKVIYHTGDTDTSNIFLSTELNRLIKPSLPLGAHLGIKRWPTDLMHNRFILSDFGGVTFGIGLDDDNNHNIEKDTITPIPPAVCFLQKCDQQPINYMDPNIISDLAIEKI